MIKRFVIVLTVLFLFMPPLIVRADAVMGNDFEFKNRDKTEPLNRSFYVNGPNGRASAKEAPGSKTEVTSYENGRIIEIASVYRHRGTYWGITPMGHAYYMPGWFLMDDLLLYYDRKDFEDEHKDEFYDYTGDFEVLWTSEEFYIWRWPGSDRAIYKYEVDEYAGLDESAIHPKYAYMDENGREWVYIRIWDGFVASLSRYGSADGWVCMSDPSNNDIPAFNPAPESRKWTPGREVDWKSDYIPEDDPNNVIDDGTVGNIVGSTGAEATFHQSKSLVIMPAMLLIIIPALVVSAGVVVLILVLRKRKRQKP